MLSVYSAIRRGSAKELRFQLFNLTDSERVDLSNSSVLAAAVIARNVSAVKNLLEFGVCVDVPCVYYEDIWWEILEHTNITPLGIAALIGDAEVTRLLLEYKEDTKWRSSCGDTPLLLSIYPQRADAFKLLIESGDCETLSEDGYNALMVACGQSKIRLVKYLIRRKFCLDYQRIDGNTALHDVSRSYHFNLKIIKLLVRAGAKNLPNAFGVTPAINAAHYNHHFDILIKEKTTDEDYISCELVSIFAPLANYRSVINFEKIGTLFNDLLDKFETERFEYFAQRPFQHLKQILSDFGIAEITCNMVGFTEKELCAQGVIQHERFFSAHSGKCVGAIKHLFGLNLRLCFSIIIALLEELSQSATMIARTRIIDGHFNTVTMLIDDACNMTAFNDNSARKILSKLFDTAVLVFCKIPSAKRSLVYAAVKVLIKIGNKNPNLGSCTDLANVLLEFHNNAYNSLPRISCYHIILEKFKMKKTSLNSVVNLVLLGLKNISNINFVDDSGATLLTTACSDVEKFSVFISKLLKHKDIDVDIPDYSGATALTLTRDMHSELYESMLPKITLKCLAAICIPRTFSCNPLVPVSIRKIIQDHTVDPLREKPPRYHRIPRIG